MPTSLAELIRDPLWQFVGVVLALAAIATSYLQYRASAARKELAFGVLASRRLIAIADNMAPRVSILLDGQPVSNVYLVEFGLKNSGNQPILRDDFDEPVRLTSATATTTLSVQVIRTHPLTLAAEITQYNDTVQLAPLLLNPGDFIVVQALTSGSRPHYSITARIAGVPSFVKINTGWRIHPLPFFPFSHPLTGASLTVFLLIIFAGCEYIIGNRTEALFSIAFSVILAILSLGHWYIGKRNLHQGRYIDEA